MANSPSYNFATKLIQTNREVAQCLAINFAQRSCLIIIHPLLSSPVILKYSNLFFLTLFFLSPRCSSLRSIYQTNLIQMYLPLYSYTLLGRVDLTVEPVNQKGLATKIFVVHWTELRS